MVVAINDDRKKGQWHAKLFFPSNPLTQKSPNDSFSWHLKQYVLLFFPFSCFGLPIGNELIFMARVMTDGFEDGGLYFHHLTLMDCNAEVLPCLCSNMQIKEISVPYLDLRGKQRKCFCFSWIPKQT